MESTHVWGKLLELRYPVMEDAERADDEEVLGVLQFANVRVKGDGLQGLAQTHLVGWAGA